MRIILCTSRGFKIHANEEFVEVELTLNMLLLSDYDPSMNLEP